MIHARAIFYLPLLLLVCLLGVAADMCCLDSLADRCMTWMVVITRRVEGKSK